LPFLTGGELDSSTRRKIKYIEEQDNVILASEIFETDLISCTGGKTEVWSWTPDLSHTPGFAYHDECQA
jgi:hypothetical protein